MLALRSAYRCATNHACCSAGTVSYWRCRELYQQLGDAGDVAQACKRTQASCFMWGLIDLLPGSCGCTATLQRTVSAPYCFLTWRTQGTHAAATRSSHSTSLHSPAMHVPYHPRSPCCTAPRRLLCRVCLPRSASWRQRRGRVRNLHLYLVCCGLLVWAHVLALHVCGSFTGLAQCSIHPSTVELHRAACRRCRPAAAGRAVPADRLPGERASLPDTHAGSGGRGAGLAVLWACSMLALLPGGRMCVLPVWLLDEPLF